MRVSIYAVGRLKTGPERDLVERYLHRFTRSGPGMGLEFAGVSEMAESRAKSAAERKREEAHRLEDALGDAVLVLIDERGANLSSQDLAGRIAKLRDTGRRRLVLAIGGADGHDETLRRRAAFAVAFGAQTWPHQIVRIMLAEQLYRAVTILSGHPYHRE